jgi:DNA-directed RNA polymerase I subunit RPA12
MVNESCPKCKHPQLYFYTMQLRSVDEGQTVFYECGNCEHKFSTDN